MADFAGDGIITKINFKKDNSYWGTKEYLLKEEILEIISKRIDMNLYEIIDTADGFVLLLKPKMINEHLKDFLEEIVSVNPLSVNWLRRKCYLYFNTFDIFTIDFKIDLNDKFEYELYGNKTTLIEKEQILFDNYNKVYCPNKAIGYLVEVSFICLGRQYEKVLSEDNSYPLYLMNKNLSRFDSPISTAFVYAFIDN